MGQEAQEGFAMIGAGFKERDGITFHELALSLGEMERFRFLGLITQEEIEETGWDQLADDLTLQRETFAQVKKGVIRGYAQVPPLTREVMSDGSLRAETTFACG